MRRDYPFRDKTVTGHDLASTCWPRDRIAPIILILCVVLAGASLGTAASGEEPARDCDVCCLGKAS
jgi:hypothetical protein